MKLIHVSKRGPSTYILKLPAHGQISLLFTIYKETTLWQIFIYCLGSTCKFGFTYSSFVNNHMDTHLFSNNTTWLNLYTLTYIHKVFSTISLLHICIHTLIYGDVERPSHIFFNHVIDISYGWLGNSSVYEIMWNMYARVSNPSVRHSKCWYLLRTNYLIRMI